MGQAQFDLAGQTACLAEVDEILQRESKGDRFAKVYRDVLVWLLDICVLADGYGTTPDIALAGKADAIFRCFDRDFTLSMIASCALCIVTYQIRT